MSYYPIKLWWALNAFIVWTVFRSVTGAWGNPIQECGIEPSPIGHNSSLGTTLAPRKSYLLLVTQAHSAQTLDHAGLFLEGF